MPWFARWHDSPIRNREFLSLTLQEIENGNAFPFIKNIYSYELNGNFIEPINRELIDLDLNVIKSSDTVLSINLDRIISDYISRHQLYHLINDNIESGESVEIYSQWLDWDAPDI